MIEKDINWNSQNQSVDDLLADLDDESGIESIKKVRKKTKIALKIKLIWYLSVLMGLFLIILIWWYYFFKLSTKPFYKLNTYEKQYVETIWNLLEMISQNTSNTINVNLNKNSTIQSEQIYSYIKNPWIIFYNKLSFKNKFENDSLKQINNLKKNLDKYQNLLVTYNFFPKELQDVVKNIRLLPILITLNSIKLYTLDYVYIKTNQFYQKIFKPVYTRSTLSTINEKALYKAVVEDILSFKDQWTYIFLKNIYFNYMYDETNYLAKNYFIENFSRKFNKIINERYKHFERIGLQLSKENFKEIYITFIKTIYLKTLELEENEEEFLPVSIQLLSYNPSTEQLNFSIKLMLSSNISDKITAVQLMSDIVTMLRESRLVIGKTITYDNLQVREITKIIWWYKLTFKTASKNFTTSVQPKPMVEVTDESY